MVCVLIGYFVLSHLVVAVLAVVGAFAVSAIPALDHKRTSLVGAAVGLSIGGVFAVFGWYGGMMVLMLLCDVVGNLRLINCAAIDGLAFNRFFLLGIYGVSVTSGALVGWRRWKPRAVPATQPIWMEAMSVVGRAGEQRDATDKGR